MNPSYRSISTDIQAAQHPRHRRIVASAIALTLLPLSGVYAATSTFTGFGDPQPRHPAAQVELDSINFQGSKITIEKYDRPTLDEGVRQLEEHEDELKELLDKGPQFTFKPDNCALFDKISDLLPSMENASKALPEAFYHGTSSWNSPLQTEIIIHKSPQNNYDIEGLRSFIQDCPQMTASASMEFMDDHISTSTSLTVEEIPFNLGAENQFAFTFRGRQIEDDDNDSPEWAKSDKPLKETSIATASIGDYTVIVLTAPNPTSENETAILDSYRAVDLLEKVLALIENGGKENRS